MEKFHSDLKLQGVPPLGEDTEGAILPSAGELFVFYKKCMVQCIQLSTGKALQSLTMTFKKYLLEYANKLLMANLPKLVKFSCDHCCVILVFIVVYLLFFIFGFCN